MPGLSSDEKKQRLSRMSYQEFLRDLCTRTSVLDFYRARTHGEWVSASMRFPPGIAGHSDFRLSRHEHCEGIDPAHGFHGRRISRHGRIAAPDVRRAEVTSTLSRSRIADVPGADAMLFNLGERVIAAIDCA